MASEYLQSWARIDVYLNVSKYHFSSITFLIDLLSLNDDQGSLNLALVWLPILIGICLLYIKTLSFCAISFMIVVPSFQAWMIHIIS